MQIAGKTFLSGEYAVLEGGSAIGMATKPYFEFSEIQSPNFEKINIHPESTAGLYLKLKNQKIENLFIENGYGVGGFGQSTAEFIYTWLKVQKQSWPLTKNKHLDIYQDYLNLFTENQSIKPSGADLLTQINSGISVFKNDQSAAVQSIQWPFKNYEVLIFSTGLKIKTHEHLQNLDRKHCRDLVGPSDLVVKNFLDQNYDQFLLSMKTWVRALQDKGLTHPDILEVVSKLSSQFSDCVFKPCGALGADVIAVITPLGLRDTLIKYAESIKLKYQTSSSNLSIF